MIAQCELAQVGKESPWSSLETLDCDDNTLTSLSCLSLFPKAHVVNFSHNRISELSHDICQLTKVATLSLAFNHLRSLRPLMSTLTFDSLKFLTSLNVSNNMISSMQGLECLLGLVELDLSNNSISCFDELR